ncbi:uncharacterized protein LOC143017465 isoform X2 [Oratosquilla oratoria]|uniref:uncharacterized protein LOC143017465 isoform X2 n=1 Tax=Oratosquilla oratoria TaxID=337810 RepID=UPI003F75F742
MVFHHRLLGVYILIFTLVLLFLETTWAVRLFLQVCIRNDNSRILTCWSAVEWLDTWKKATLYAVSAIAVLVKPHRLWLTTLAGSQLCVLAGLHLLLMCKARLDVKEALLEAKDDVYESEEEQEGDAHHGDSDTASNLDYVLQV